MMNMTTTITMFWFSVSIQAEAPDARARAVIRDEAADKLMDLLVEHDGVVASGDGTWNATISIEQATAVDAAATGSALVEAMAAEAGMPRWPVVRVNAVREDLLEADNASATLPELASVPDAAEILGVSPQRVHELAAGQGFPKPVYDLTVGKLWLRAAIEEFGHSRNRKPGRPDRGTLMRQRVTSALLDAGITMALINVIASDDGRAVRLQLASGGSSHMRRRVAAKAIAALSSAGLGISADVRHLTEDVEVYLAAGHEAEVSDLPEPTARRA